MMRRCAISIDLDDLACYYRIHGLGEMPPELGSVIFEAALPRAAALLARHGAAATWFVVGRDVDPRVGAAGAAAGREALAALHRAGHELGNHSYSHPYRLARMSPAEVAREVDDCDELLRGLTGAPVRGFRAPGYDVSATVARVLASRGYRYDSSVLPAPAYYAAKAAVMGAMAARGRPSRAVLTDPRALLASRRPYRLDEDAPWRSGASSLIEVPIAVTPWLRLPVIGTSMLLAPAPLRRCLLMAVREEGALNFELHGIDFVDAERDGVPGELVERQPDLRVPVARKLERLDALLDALGRRFQFTTLAELAEAARAA
ncbi:MAG: polysaccharide deacetylase family protein [Kofleriaceae bacterium]